MAKISGTSRKSQRERGVYLNKTNLADPGNNRDTITVLAINERAAKASAERDIELDALIAMGWGDTDPERIPADWRTRRKEKAPKLAWDREYHRIYVRDNRDRINAKRRARRRLIRGLIQ